MRRDGKSKCDNVQIQIEQRPGELAPPARDGLEADAQASWYT